MKSEKQIHRQEYQTTINNIPLTLKFAEKSNDSICNEVISILTGSYQSRIVKQNPTE